MSIDSASASSSFHCKKTLRSSISDADNMPHARHSLKECQNQLYSKTRAMSITEETSGDLLTDLSSVPKSQINSRYQRRYSDLRSPLIQQTPPVMQSERRNSIPQINFSSLLPNPFRSKKHHHKSTKEESNATLNTAYSTNSLFSNDTMATKVEQPFSSKPLNTVTNSSRTNLSNSTDRLSLSGYDDSASSRSSISSLFTFDTRECEPCSAETLTIELRAPLCISDTYREDFFQYFHVNYCGEFEQDIPYLASLRYVYFKSNPSDSTLISPDTVCQARAIIRTPTGNYDVSTTTDGTNEDNILQTLFRKAHLPTVNSNSILGDPKANEKIYLFDKVNDERQNCKIGLIYQRADQTNEFDIYNNDNLSSDLQSFLNILADRVNLKGFHKFRGDLDIKDDVHGEYSYYTKYKKREIMFNIAPIIRSTKTNGQCVERKGLVGNAFVCIVFQEPNAEFSPDLISGRVTQIYITVQPCNIDDNLYYKIGIWHRNDFTPKVEPPGGVYKCDQSFRDYFLTLLINSIHAATESPSLRSRVLEQRQRLKQEELKKLVQNLSVRQIFDTAADVEATNNPLTHHGNSRSESFISTIPQSNESLSTNPDRVSPVPSKKRGIMKLFGVFTNRSSSTSLSPTTAAAPLNLVNENVQGSNSTLQDASTPQNRINNKEPEGRRASLKYRPAPLPPPPHASMSQTANLSSPIIELTQPPTPTSSTPTAPDTDQEFLAQKPNLLNTNGPEVIRRNRSNSSPPENINGALRYLVVNIPKINEEVNSIGSSIEEDEEDDESIDNEKQEHRQTLTEFSSIAPSDSNP